MGYICCFCNKDMGDYYGNSPYPIIKGFGDKSCCDECNENIVMPFRHYDHFGTIESLKTIKEYIYKMNRKPKGCLVIDRRVPAHETSDFIVKADIIKELVSGRHIHILERNNEFVDLYNAFGKDFIDIVEDKSAGHGMCFRVKEMILNSVKKGKEVVIIDPKCEFKEIANVLRNKIKHFNNEEIKE